LRQQLKGALRGTKVGQTEHRVGGDHTGQGDVGEVVPFGDHLSADKNLDGACGKGSEGVLQT
jgi:hypothetical protein